MHTYVCICTYVAIHLFLNVFLYHIATLSSVGPIPTGGSPGKISMCIIICNVHPFTYIHPYICTFVNYVCQDFSEPIDWHLAVLHTCIRTYVCMYTST